LVLADGAVICAKDRADFFLLKVIRYIHPIWKQEPSQLVI
jgi:hypothetical protein